MENFPITRLEIISGKNDDAYAYSILRKLYKGRINFGIVEEGFKGLLVWKSKRHVRRDGVLIAIYDMQEYK